MPRINPDLLIRMENKLGLSRRRVYELVDEKVRNAHLPRHLAAIAVASERDINISRFASTEDLAAIRQTAMVSPRPIVVSAPAAVEKATKKKARGKAKAPVQKRRGTTVFVVHGRNKEARDGIFSFLRALELRPLEWSQALRLTRKGSPYVGEVLDAAFGEAAAIVVLLTSDDEARLKKKFVNTDDPEFESKLTGQARPNVLFEAGMAFGRNSNSTILVQIGKMRPFSDVGGRHVVHLNNSHASRNEFAVKLANAGCNVNTSGTDWMTEGDFDV